MSSYLRGVKRLLRKALHIALPPESSIQSAEIALSTSPVAGYPAFTADEVRLLAAYRAGLSKGSRDLVWEAIANDD